MALTFNAPKLFIVTFGILLISSIIGVCPQTAQDPVEKYTNEDFLTNIILKSHYVLFYVPWHGDTKSILPIWEELGHKYNGPNSDVKIVKVDCVQEKDLCARQDVSDSPTIKFYTIGGDAEGVRYRGVRDFHSLEQFFNTITKRLSSEFAFGARVQVPPPPVNGLNYLQDENFEQVVQNGNAIINFCTPWSTKCMDLEPVWKELAKQFQFDDDVIFGTVDCTHHKKTCNENEIRGYPSILWLEDGIVEEKYPSKERDIESLRAYVFKKLGKQEVKKPTIIEEDPYKSVQLVLTQDNFKTEIETNDLIFVNFMTPWCTPCQALERFYEDLALKFNAGKQIKIAKVDCTRSKALCDEQEVDEFPTLNLYRKGKLVGPYTDAHKLDDLVDFCNAAIEYSKDEL